MIKVRVVKKGANFEKISILGHAMYDDYGKDIVCSAVSSIVTTTVNGLLSLDRESISYLVSNKGMTITVKSLDRTTQVLIRNMISLLKELEKNYKDNVEVK
jgi:uncharacterized protein YsxB (DUF464 family)